MKSEFAEPPYQRCATGADTGGAWFDLEAGTRAAHPKKPGYFGQIKPEEKTMQKLTHEQIAQVSGGNQTMMDTGKAMMKSPKPIIRAVGAATFVSGWVASKITG